ncbi:hypothetical protein C0581_02510 [Candidatus Parcubacteria bacterium]|nr:MAG: hypothetical protein C0581_02510 [Candidatus Parcubacteria bacterium]
MKLSLRVRTIIPIALTIVIFGLFAVGSISWFARDNLLDGAQKDLELIVHEKSREIGRLFDTSQKLAKTLSQNSFLISYLENDEEIIYQDEHILEHFEQGNIGGQYSAIYVMGVDGVTYVSTDEAFVGNNYGFRPYFKGAVQGESVVSVARGVTSGKLGYYFSHPVYSQDDIIGVVVAKLNPDLVQDYISFGELGDGFHVMFTDQYGVVVYSDISERLFRSVGALDKDVITFIKDERTYEGVEIRPLQYDDVQDVIRAGSGVATIWIYDEMDAKDELLVVDYVEGYPFYLIVEQDVETFVRPIN